jgi:hypothetical protein
MESAKTKKTNTAKTIQAAAPAVQTPKRSWSQFLFIKPTLSPRTRKYRFGTTPGFATPAGGIAIESTLSGGERGGRRQESQSRCRGKTRESTRRRVRFARHGAFEAWLKDSHQSSGQMTIEEIFRGIIREELAMLIKTAGPPMRIVCSVHRRPRKC